MSDPKDASIEEKLRSIDLYAHFDSVIIERGVRYYNERRVQKVVFAPDLILGTVQGQSKNYHVTLRLYRETKKSFLHFTCTCPYGNYCKHMVATILKVREILSKDEVNFSGSTVRGTQNPAETPLKDTPGHTDSLRVNPLDPGDRVEPWGRFEANRIGVNRNEKERKEPAVSRLQEISKALREIPAIPAMGSGSQESLSKPEKSRKIKGVILGILSPPYYLYESYCTLRVYKVLVSDWSPLAELVAAWPSESPQEEFWKQVRILFQEDTSWVNLLTPLNFRKENPEEWGLTPVALGAVYLLDQYERTNRRSIDLKGTVLSLLFSTGVPLFFWKDYQEPALGARSRKRLVFPLEMISEPFMAGIRIHHQEGGGVRLEGVLCRSGMQGSASGKLQKQKTAEERIDQYRGIEPSAPDPGQDLLDGFSLQEGLPLHKGLLKVASDPNWYMAKGKVFRVQNEEALHLLSGWSMELSPQDTERFRLEILPDLLPVLPVLSPLLMVNRVQERPVPRLYLSEDERGLRLELRFAYTAHEVGASDSTEGVVTPMEEPWQYTLLLRDLEEEKRWADWILTQNPGLKKAPKPDPYGTYRLKKKLHPVDFLLYTLPLFAQEGVEIFGEEGLVHARVNRHKPSIWMSVESGIDWFDLKGGVRFGDQLCGLKEILHAVKRGERYVKLGDGSLGVLPAEWIRRFEDLEIFGQWREESLRFHSLHAPLVEPLWEGGQTGESSKPGSSVDASAAQKGSSTNVAGGASDTEVMGLEGAASNAEVVGLEKLRKRLARFRRIDPIPLPKDFFGTLRPYQVHGYQWLHFLRSVKVGGILADDMGLGKTIQVLAYLQSLKEMDPPTRAHLLVVPKSLVYNWQAEASRFTPGLRFLEYMGQKRTENVEEFDAYDVVITTYATMLRDVEKLKVYPFHHVILDESQAIKNPLALSNRAARSLQAEHRLVLTGTPMENNILELWSQFAFLEPALLGPLNRFKSTLGNRIERGDKHALEVIKTLIYPFLLRRTKEQVAPELPPRMEETLYAEMEGEQEKLYHAVREQYRLEIEELLDSGEPWLARTKILEGLLRLRQIAIHPSLYDGRKRFASAKFLLLMDVLGTLQEERHRGLIFSQFVEALKLLRKELDMRKIPYAYLDGQTQKRKEEVERFQTDSSVPFFLISLKAGGTGLNLTAADYVLLLDPWWNPAVEAQAADRTHRIGQDKPVFVYRFIARGTVEEKILLLQEKKRDIVSSVIRNDTGIFKSLTQEDIEALFSR